MASPYLLEIRTGGDLKRELRDIIYDVSNEFDVHTVAKPRAVPHITLFGPYNTDKGYQVRDTVLEVLGQFDIVPYRISGFEHFNREVIYANVIPSPQLRDLRQQLSNELRPITYNYQKYDSEPYYDFHVTIARGDLDGKFEEIWEYLNTAYEPTFDEYATRITALEYGDMMWEFDLLRGKKLSSAEATSAKSWEKTTALLEERKNDTDHEELAPKPGIFARLAQLLR